MIEVKYKDGKLRSVKNIEDTVSLKEISKEEILDNLYYEVIDTEYLCASEDMPIIKISDDLYLCFVFNLEKPEAVRNARQFYTKFRMGLRTIGMHITYEIMEKYGIALEEMQERAKKAEYGVIRGVLFATPENEKIPLGMIKDAPKDLSREMAVLALYDKNMSNITSILLDDASLRDLRERLREDYYIVLENHYIAYLFPKRENETLEAIRDTFLEFEMEEWEDSSEYKVTIYEYSGKKLYVHRYRKIRTSER